MNDLTDNPAGQFINGCLHKVCQRFNLPITPEHTLTDFSHSAFGQLGHLQVIPGGNHPHILKVMQLTLKFPPMGASAHALHIITRADSVLPHFSAECVYYDPTVDSPLGKAHDGPASYGFYINLISRVDPGANLDYMEHVYGPLEQTVQALEQNEAIEFAQLSRYQQSLFQPWVVVVKPTPHFETMQGVFKDYLHRCADLIDHDLPQGLVSADDIARSAARDAVNRGTYLSPRVDHIWPRIDALIGEENGVQLRTVLTSQVAETTWTATPSNNTGS